MAEPAAVAVERRFPLFIPVNNARKLTMADYIMPHETFRALKHAELQEPDCHIVMSAFSTA